MRALYAAHFEALRALLAAPDALSLLRLQHGEEAGSGCALETSCMGAVLYGVKLTPLSCWYLLDESLLAQLLQAVEACCPTVRPGPGAGLASWLAAQRVVPRGFAGPLAGPPRRRQHVQTAWHPAFACLALYRNERKHRPYSLGSCLLRAQETLDTSGAAYKAEALGILASGCTDQPHVAIALAQAGMLPMLLSSELMLAALGRRSVRMQ